MKVKLFCFPFAGGSKYSYTLFQRYLSKNIELVPLDIPGRGSRFSEPLLYDLNDIVSDVFSQIENQLSTPFAFFGHSMGTLISYLLTEQLADKNLPLPVHLFLSGRGGPKSERYGRNWHLLPKAEFREKLLELGGSPKEVLEEERLMEIIEPILRADFQAAELFKYNNVKSFDIPVTVMIGKQEITNYQEALLWQEIATQPIKIHEFDGGHFFILNHPEQVMKIVETELQNSIKVLKA